MWKRPPANNLPQTPRSAGAYGTGYVLLCGECQLLELLLCGEDLFALLVAAPEGHLRDHIRSQLGELAAQFNFSLMAAGLLYLRLPLLHHPLRQVRHDHGHRLRKRRG